MKFNVLPVDKSLTLTILVCNLKVLDLLIIVLHQTHKEAEDKWRKLSRQIVDQLLPLLASQQVGCVSDEK